MAIKERLEELRMLQTRVSGLSKSNSRLKERSNKLNSVLGEILSEIGDTRPDIFLKYINFYEKKDN